MSLLYCSENRNNWNQVLFLFIKRIVIFVSFRRLFHLPTLTFTQFTLFLIHYNSSTFARNIREEFSIQNIDIWPPLLSPCYIPFQCAFYKVILCLLFVMFIPESVACRCQGACKYILVLFVYYFIYHFEFPCDSITSCSIPIQSLVYNFERLLSCCGYITEIETHFVCIIEVMTMKYVKMDSKTVEVPRKQ